MEEATKERAIMKKLSGLLCLLFLISFPLAVQALTFDTIQLKAEMSAEGVDVLWVLVDTDKDNSELGYILHVRTKFHDRDGRTDEELTAFVDAQEQAFLAQKKAELTGKTDVKASIKLKGN
jgi:hypothetical protein